MHNQRLRTNLQRLAWQPTHEHAAPHERWGSPPRSRTLPSSSAPLSRIWDVPGCCPHREQPGNSIEWGEEGVFTVLLMPRLFGLEFRASTACVSQCPHVGARSCSSWRPSTQVFSTAAKVRIATQPNCSAVPCCNIRCPHRRCSRDLSQQ